MIISCYLKKEKLDFYRQGDEEEYFSIVII